MFKKIIMYTGIALISLGSLCSQTEGDSYKTLAEIEATKMPFDIMFFLTGNFSAITTYENNQKSFRHYHNEQIVGSNIIIYDDIREIYYSQKPEVETMSMGATLEVLALFYQKFGFGVGFDYSLPNKIHGHKGNFSFAAYYATVKVGNFYNKQMAQYAFARYGKSDFIADDSVLDSYVLSDETRKYVAIGLGLVVENHVVVELSVAQNKCGLGYNKTTIYEEWDPPQTQPKEFLKEYNEGTVTLTRISFSVGYKF